MHEYLRAMLTIRLRSERGATVTEYGLLLAGVAFALVLVVIAWKNGLSEMFNFYKNEGEDSSPG